MVRHFISISMIRSWISWAPQSTSMHLSKSEKNEEKKLNSEILQNISIFVLPSWTSDECNEHCPFHEDTLFSVPRKSSAEIFSAFAKASHTKWFHIVHHSNRQNAASLYSRNGKKCTTKIWLFRPEQWTVQCKEFFQHRHTLEILTIFG